jgi:molybdenum cofactor cytidylyltransferase
MEDAAYAIVLAAGSASRYGSTKQLAKIDGSSLVARTIAAANDALGGRTVVVLGHDAAAIADEIQEMAGFVVVNERFEDGLGTSIARAIKAVRHVASAAVVMLADQPGITASHISGLVEAWGGRASAIVATEFGETQGPPALFAADCFDDLETLRGDAGGKHLFADERFDVTSIVFEPAALDIDTPDDLASF